MPPGPGPSPAGVSGPHFTLSLHGPGFSRTLFCLRTASLHLSLRWIILPLEMTSDSSAQLTPSPHRSVWATSQTHSYGPQEPAPCQFSALVVEGPGTRRGPWEA